MENSEKVRLLETELVAKTVELEAMRHMLSMTVNQLALVSNVQVEAILVPDADKCQMVMQLYKNNEMRRIVNTKTDHGLMIVPVDGRYQIFTIVLPQKGLHMLVHIFRWLMVSEYSGRFIEIQQAIMEGTRHESL